MSAIGGARRNDSCDISQSTLDFVRESCGNSRAAARHSEAHRAGMQDVANTVACKHTATDTDTRPVREQQACTIGHRALLQLPDATTSANPNDARWGNDKLEVDSE